MEITPLEQWIAAKIGCEGQPLTVEQLRSYQLEKLNQTISLVQSRSPFYRKALGPRRIALSSLDELADLPFSTAPQLSSAPREFLCVRPDEVSRIVTLSTSGTTGTPKRIFFTADDQELTIDFFRWGMSTMVGAGDRVLILLPGSLPGSVGDLLKIGLGRMNAEGIVHGPVTNPLNTLHVMEQEQVTALVGVPVQVLWLARLSAANRSHHSMSLRSVLLSTDHVPSAIVKVIENTWGCEVYNHYGMTEMGLGGGVDCGARNGYHVREADMLFEIVDPASGRPAAQGEWGEVVFTTLTRNAMPLIRYRTGDISRLVPEPCPCGTVLRRLAHVDQRVLGNIHLPGGEILSQKEFDEALFAIDGLADFKVICAKKGRRVALALHVKYFDDAPKPREEEVVRALLGIPLLSSGADCGQISWDVSGWDAEDDVNPGTKKRRISSREGR